MADFCKCGKTLKEYEWTLLKRLVSNEADYLDKEFRKGLRKKSTSKD